MLLPVIFPATAHADAVPVLTAGRHVADGYEHGGGLGILQGAQTGRRGVVTQDDRLQWPQNTVKG